MRKNRVLGKFMQRNLLPICIYATAMGLALFVPLQWGNYLTLQLGGVTLFTSIFLGYLNYQHAQDRLFKDLFKEFNERYDRFNGHFERIRDNYNLDVVFEQVDKTDAKIIVDYLNLCAEEFFWFEKGRIEESAWKSWESGMEIWSGLPCVYTVFYGEVATWKSSYYSGFQLFFKELIEKNTTLHGGY